jgi:hypothetical protein
VIDNNVVFGEAVALNSSSDNDGGNELPDLDLEASRDVSVRQSMIINTASGNDRVAIGRIGQFVDSVSDTSNGDRFFSGGDVRVRRNLIINTGTGHDDVALGDTFLPYMRTNEIDGPYSLAIVSVGHNLIINTHGGNDDVQVAATEIGDDLIINTSSGNDTVRVGGGDLDTMFYLDGGMYETDIRVGVVVGDDAVIHTCSGRDAVALGGDELGGEMPDYYYEIPTGALRVRDVLIVNTGSSRDELELMFVDTGDDTHIHTGSGDDVVAMEFIEIGDDLHLHTSSGEDQVMLFEVSVRDDAFMNTGSNSDEVKVDEFFSGDYVRLLTGSGRDESLLTGIAARRALANMGSGNDLLAIGDSTIDKLVTLHGGSGFDELDNQGGNSYGRLIVHSFEVD